PGQGVYRIDADGRVTLVAANAGKPNGIAVSPDQTTLYVASIDNGSLDEGMSPEMPVTPGRMALLAYDLAPDGSVKFRRTVVDFTPDVGPDGISVDRDGNIYCAIPGRERHHGQRAVHARHHPHDRVQVRAQPGHEVREEPVPQRRRERQRCECSRWRHTGDPGERHHHATPHR